MFIILIVLFFQILIIDTLNWRNMIDVKYYVEAIKFSKTLSNSFISGALWSFDFGFVFLSFLLNFFNLDPHYFIPLLISCFIFFPLFKLIELYPSFNFFIIIALIFSSTYFGLLFNLWRQGISIAVFYSILIYSKKQYLSILASIFHFNSLLPLVLTRVLLEFKGKKIRLFLILLFLILVSLIPIYFQKFHLGLNMAYGSIYANNTTYIRLIVYFLIWKLILFSWNYDLDNSLVKISDYLNSSFIFCGLILFFYPSAVERFSHFQQLGLCYMIFLVPKSHNRLRSLSYFFSFFLLVSISFWGFYHSKIVELVFSNSVLKSLL